MRLNLDFDSCIHNLKQGMLVLLPARSERKCRQKKHLGCLLEDVSSVLVFEKFRFT